MALSEDEIMCDMPEFCSGHDANQAHVALQKSVEIRDRAQHCAVLWFGEIMRRELYRELGYSTMRAYAPDALGFSATRAGDFMRLARKLEQLPVVKQEMVAGNLGYTVVREITTVADASNEDQWVKEAKTTSRRQLVATVKQAKAVAQRQRQANPNQGVLLVRPVPTEPPATAPIRLGFELTPAQHARYEAMLAKIGHRGDKADLLLDMVEALMTKTEIAPRGAIRPPVQIHVHLCPDCQKATISSPQGESELTATEAEAANCDAQIHAPGQPNKSTIPPRIRREVLTRDRHRCRRKGCDHTRFLHLHHLVPRAKGGGNAAENLVTLCTACHDLWHRKGGDLQAMLTAAPQETG